MKRLLILYMLPITLIGIFLFFNHSASAVVASDWRAGRIIDDTKFTGIDMSVSDIQIFLNNKVPSCDTWGTQPASEYGRGDITHAQYAASRGWPGPPYVCLKDYYEVPKPSPSPGVPLSSYNNSGNPPSGSISAAQMIYNAAQQYQISPKVLLVKLGTESAGPLTTDRWPLSSQYNYAMGAHCPDSGEGGTADCDSNYAGFSIQISEAAALLRWYLNSMNQPWWQYKKPSTSNYILWNVEQSGCGGSNVYIETMATAALYTYTPYQPNQEALNNMYGTGNRCSSYGNRNFWRVYNDWFGSSFFEKPICDSVIQDVKCVWELNKPDNRSQFLTLNEEERDATAISSGYYYKQIAFYAFTKNAPGRIPVYRIKLENRHFFTPSLSEVNSLMQNPANKYEGSAFYALEHTAGQNYQYTVHRYYNINQFNILASSGSAYQTPKNIDNASYEGTSFDTPSPFLSTPSSELGNINIYRLYNKRSHIYTASIEERDSLMRQRWDYEGVLMETPGHTNIKPVFRMHKDHHIFTDSLSEIDELVNKGWSLEGVAWYNGPSIPQVYRFSNLNDHLYTVDSTEAFSVSNININFDGVVFGSTQSESYPVYRFYDGKSHFFTADITEGLKIANIKWKYEGVAFYSPNQSNNPVYRLKGPYHFYTSSASEINALTSNGWKNEGVAF